MWKYLSSSERIILSHSGSGAFWKMVRLSLVLISVVSGWLLVQSHQNIPDNTIATGEEGKRINDISAGLTSPGTRLYLHGTTAIAPDAIRVTTPSQNFRLNDLSQLKGLMRISDAVSALRLVRLRTLDGYDTCWPSAILEVSCIDQEPGYKTAHKSNSSISKMPDSGMNAVLSPKAYHQGGFHAPTIVKVPNGYQITRWVCLFSGFEGSQVQKWQETVSPDGSYRLQVLLSKPVPSLPGTNWGMMARA